MKRPVLGMVSLAIAAAVAAGPAALAAPNPVRIGAVFAQTGPFAVAGTDSMHGAQLAVDQINAQGGIKSLHGAPLELVAGDSQSTPITAQSEAERLISEQKVAVLLGSSTTGETIPMTGVAEKYGVPMIVPIAQGAAITGRGLKWIWSSTLLDPDYVNGLFNALDIVRAMDPKVTKLGVLVPDNDYGVEMGRLIKERLATRKDVTLVGMEQVNSRDQDYTGPVLKLKANAPDVVMQVGYFRDGVQYAKAYEQLDFHPVVIGTGGASGDPKLKNEIGALTEGEFAVVPFSVDRAVVKPIADAYAKKYGQPLTLNSALAYQAVLVVRTALEKAGSTDPAAIADALRHVRLSGKDVITDSDYIAFDASGRNTGRDTAITQFQNGDVVTVAPKSKAVAKPKLERFNSPH